MIAVDQRESVLFPERHECVFLGWRVCLFVSKVEFQKSVSWVRKRKLGKQFVCLEVRGGSARARALVCFLRSHFAPKKNPDRKSLAGRNGKANDATFSEWKGKQEIRRQGERNDAGLGNHFKIFGLEREKKTGVEPKAGIHFLCLWNEALDWGKILES